MTALFCSCSYTHDVYAWSCILLKKYTGYCHEKLTLIKLLEQDRKLFLLL